MCWSIKGEPSPEHPIRLTVKNTLPIRVTSEDWSEIHTMVDLTGKPEGIELSIDSYDLAASLDVKLAPIDWDRVPEGTDAPIRVLVRSKTKEVMHTKTNQLLGHLEANYPEE